MTIFVGFWLVLRRRVVLLAVTEPSNNSAVLPRASDVETVEITRDFQQQFSTFITATTILL